MQYNRLRSRISSAMTASEVQRAAHVAQWVTVSAALSISLAGIGRFVQTGTAVDSSLVLIPASCLTLIAFLLMGVRLHGESVEAGAARKSARDLERKYSHLLNGTQDLVMLVDRDGRILFVNQPIETKLGRQAWDLVGTAFTELTIGSEQFRAGWMLEAARNGYGPTPTRLPLQSLVADELIVEATAINRLNDEAVRAIVVSARDITNEIALIRERDASAALDRLTGLPNRESFMATLERALDRSHRLRRPVALAMFDLDNFCLINDTFGAPTGDAVLHTVGSRFGESLTALESVARLGSNRFAVVLEECSADDAADRIARIHQFVMKELMINGRPIQISACVGTTFRSGTAYSVATDLLSESEAALGVAKRRGPGTVISFSSSMAAPTGRLHLEHELREATVSGQFTVHYQPVVSLDGGEVVEMEALVRWNHPIRGLVSPGEFIPVAEENGLIVPIGWWVLREACEQGVRWLAARPTRPITMSVNLSPRMFREADLVQRVRSILAASNFPPASLRLEITEGVMIDDQEEAIDRLCQLKAMGVQLAIDDFGTGYSSLSYLQHFPIDVIKIDRAFISTMASSRESTEIVRSIVDLAKALHIETTGEGIETEHQLAQLRAFGSDRGQGFLFSKPMPAAELDLIMATTSGVQFAA